MKRSTECIHSQIMPCSKIYTRRECNYKMDPYNFSSCGHSVKVPCKISRTSKGNFYISIQVLWDVLMLFSLFIVSSVDMLKYCEEQCQFQFDEKKGGCGHTCKGSCSQCLHGRLHVKCQEECGKTLICGHRCNFPCSQSCPPCQQQCIFSCEHSKCKANCGEPCVQCTVSFDKDCVVIFTLL